MFPDSARPLDPLAEHDTFRRGLDAYHRGAYFEAHEYWELIWRDEPDGPKRSFLQGLIQVAAALHKLGVMKSPTGATRLFERARVRLGEARHGMFGVDIDTVIAGIDLALAALPKLHVQGEQAGADIDPAFVPHIGAAPN